MERLLRKPEVLAITSLSSTELCRRVADGRFPKPYQTGARSVAWLESEIRDWLHSIIQTGQDEQREQSRREAARRAAAARYQKNEGAAA